ncbi:MAG: hypothetical protein ABSH33_15410 [Steroidobacteraceae bacterium]|jgi:hypothetical protein
MIRHAKTAVGGTALGCSHTRVHASAVWTTTLAALAWFAASALADTSPPPAAQLNSITVQGQKERDAIQRQASAFVSAIAVQPWEKSLARWNTPICPLVAGLPRDQGEFILARLSQIVTFAGAPLAPESCRPNFYVVATKNPDALLKLWRKRDRAMFGIESEPKVRRFLNATGPVRVWYNADLDDAEGMPLSIDGLALYSGAPTGTGTGFTGVPTNLHSRLSRLQWNELRSLASVIVVVDTRRAAGVNFGPLADYIAMAGLTEVRLEADAGPTATILQLFAPAAGAAPKGLSDWDQAFLKALYHTDQSDKMQVSAITTQVARSFAR